MKRFSKGLALLAALALLGCAGLSLAEEAAPGQELDLNGLSVEELLRLRRGIEEELYSRGEGVVMTAGSYLVGRDIAPGSYILTPHNGSDSYLGFSWDFVIYRDEKARGELELAEQAYREARDRAREAREAGEEAAFPEPVDLSQYKLQEDTCTNAVSVRITLEEGQVFVLGYWRLFDQSVEVVITKAKGLFME